MDNNIQVLNDKQLTCKVWAETVRNLIFIVLAFLVIQPVFFVVISTLFGAKVLLNPPASIMIAYFWKYTFYIYRIILITSAMLLVLFAIYLVLRKHANDNSIISRLEKNKLKQDIWTNIKKYPELYFFGLTFLWITIAFFFSGDLLEQSGFGKDRGQGYIYYLCFGIWFISFFAITQKQKSLLLEMFIADAAIISLLAILVEKGIMPRIYSYSLKETGIFSNRNYFGYFLALNIVLPAARMYKSKNVYAQIYYAICIIVDEFALLITLTRGAFVGALFGIVFVLLFYLIKEKKFNIKLVIIPSLLIITFLVLELTNLTWFTERIEQHSGEEDADAISSGRLEIWAGIIEQIKGSPVIGVGFGNTPNPHNEFLQTAAWHGVPAAIFYVVALGAMYIRAFMNRNSLTDVQIGALGGAAGYIVSSFFGNGLLQTIPTYILILALCFNVVLPIKNVPSDVTNIAKNQPSTSQPLPTNLDVVPGKNG